MAHRLKNMTAIFVTDGANATNLERKLLAFEWEVRKSEIYDMQSDDLRPSDRPVCLMLTPPTESEIR